MRVVISGYYGFGNLGDEALLTVMASRLRSRHPEMHIDVLSGTPEETAASLGVEATPRWHVAAVRRAIARADVVLSGGGGLLQSSTSLRSLVYYAGILRMAIRSGRKAMIFAQSIGPLDAIGAFIVRRFCRGTNRATVRDERSRLVLSKLLPATKVERTADPVFLYRSEAGIDLSKEGLGPQSGPYAVFCLREAPGFDAAVSAFARAADRLSERHGIRAAFLPLGGRRDAAVSTKVIRACASAPVLLPESPLERAAAIIARARVVVGMRLHALIFAANGAVPFLAGAYDPKVSGLLEELRYPLAPLWKLGEKPSSLQTVDALVDELVARRDELSAHLAEQLDRVRSLAERNFDVLDELLQDR
jgi:polysaccharide pyruvyl transferase CsaB